MASIHPSIRRHRLRSSLFVLALALAVSIKTCGHPILPNHSTKRARCFPITSNTDAIFFSGRTGYRYSERPGWLLFSHFYSVHTVASPITTLRPYWISTSRINTHHVLSSPFPYPFMIRTHSFHPAFLLWLLLCFFSFGILGICCPLIPTSPVMCRITGRASGERGRRVCVDGRSLYGSHGQRIIYQSHRRASIFAVVAVILYSHSSWRKGRVDYILDDCPSADT